jgi:translation initiation factor IF-3
VEGISKDFMINEEIREKEVRLIGGDDSQIVKTRDALAMAEEQELDLVMISPTANPPVCRIMDYSKFLYEQSKKLKENKKNQKVVTLKEIRLSPTIEDNDIEIKANNAKKFLSNENKVKVSIRFRGRQNNYKDAGNKVFETFLSMIGDAGVVEKPARLEGNSMHMIMGPKKQ